MRHRIIALLTLMICGFVSEKAMAQTVNFNKSPEDFFGSYVHKKDTEFSNHVYIWDTFGKRISLHANVFEWALTIPNLGVEFDLDKTKMNNRSILVFGKYNPNTKHDVLPKFVFNLGAARIEFRKYWRTGKVSYNYYHSDYTLLPITKPDTLYRRETFVNEFGDEDFRWVPYFTERDSVRARDFAGDAYRHPFYNRYHNARRRISGRTINNAHNWRAYYAGAFVGYDRYSYCWGKHGEQGHIIAFGATAGWSIPIIASASPHEGGLDLDLGVNIGLPIAKWEGYKYVDKPTPYANYPETADPYYQRTSTKGWAVNGKYVVQDLHLSLVYRFRSIGRKVSLNIVDEYEEKEILRFKDRSNSLEEAVNRTLQQVAQHRDSMKVMEQQRADSAEWADYMIKHRLEAMLEINGDTTQFHGIDSVNYIRLILGKDTAQYRRVKETQLKESKKIAQAYADSVNAVRQAFVHDSLRSAKIQSDSIAIARRAIKRDSLHAVKDSLQREKAYADSIEQAAVQAEQQQLQAEKDRIRMEQEAQRAETERARKEAKEAVRKEKAAIKAEQERAKREVREEERRVREAQERELNKGKKDSDQKKADKLVKKMIERNDKEAKTREKASNDASSDSGTKSK